MVKGKGLRRTGEESLVDILDRFGKIHPKPKRRDISPGSDRKKQQRRSMQRAS